jgi:hypothetical protein
MNVERNQKLFIDGESGFDKTGCGWLYPQSVKGFNLVIWGRNETTVLPKISDGQQR